MPQKTTARFLFRGENGDKWEEIRELTGDEVTSLKKELEEREEYAKVIRCKDCKYVSYEPCKDYKDVYICNRTPFTRSNGGNMPDDFCSYAERE